jgi:hypothetical protein
MSDKTYKIKKTLLEKDISVILNDPLGAVAEFGEEEAIKLCQLLNSNSDSNCKYEIVRIN